MPTHKADLSELSQTQLAELTGISVPTVRRRLEGLDPVRVDGKTKWFSTKAALPRIYVGAEGTLDEHKTRLTREQADAAELKNAQMRGELIPAEDNARTIIGLATLTNQRLQGVASKVAPLAHTAETTAQAEALIAAAIDEAQAELAEAAAAVAQWDT